MQDDLAGHKRWLMQLEPDMPPELQRRFDVVFKPLNDSKAMPMRQIGADHVGQLVSVQVHQFLFVSTLNIRTFLM